MLTYTKMLDTMPGSIPVVVKMNQYDSDFTLVFNMYSTGGLITFDGDITASIRGTKTDGHGYSASATIESNVVTVLGDVQMTTSPGDNIFEIVLTKDDKELSSANFIIHVERAALDKDTIVSQSKIRELVNVIDRTDEIIAAANRVESAIQTLQSNIETAAKDAADAVKTEMQQYVLDASTARDQAQTAAGNAEDAVESASNEVLSKVQGYTFEAQAAAQSAARNAANNVRSELNNIKEETYSIYRATGQLADLTANKLETRLTAIADEAVAKITEAKEGAESAKEDTKAITENMKTAIMALLDILKARNVITQEAYQYVADIL